MAPFKKAIIPGSGLVLLVVMFLLFAPAGSAHAQQAGLAGVHVTKDCIGATGPFDVTVAAESGGASSTLLESITFPIDCGETVTVCLDVPPVAVPIGVALVAPEDCDETLTLTTEQAEVFIEDGEVVVTEELVEGVETALEDDCAPDGILTLEDFQLSGDRELDCLIVNTDPLAEVTVIKLCPLGTGDATFSIAVGGTSSVFACGGATTTEDLEAGSLTISETIVGADAENFATVITCSDGTLAPSATATLTLDGEDIECAVINVFAPGDDPTDEELLSIVLSLDFEIEIENALSNINENVNENANANENNNVNENTQNQTNDQDTNVTTGDVNVSSGGGTGSGTGAGAGSVTITPPNTGSAGMAPASGLSASTAILLATVSLIGALFLTGLIVLGVRE